MKRFLKSRGKNQIQTDYITYGRQVLISKTCLFIQIQVWNPSGSGKDIIELREVFNSSRKEEMGI